MRKKVKEKKKRLTKAEKNAQDPSLQGNIGTFFQKVDPQKEQDKQAKRQLFKQEGESGGGTIQKSSGFLGSPAFLSPSKTLKP